MWGLPGGITFQNSVLVFATTLVLLALAINMFAKGTGNNPHQGQRAALRESVLATSDRLRLALVRLLISGVLQSTQRK